MDNSGLAKTTAKEFCLVGGNGTHRLQSNKTLKFSWRATTSMSILNALVHPFAV